MPIRNSRWNIQNTYSKGMMIMMSLLVLSAASTEPCHLGASCGSRAAVLSEPQTEFREQWLGAGASRSNLGSATHQLLKEDGIAERLHDKMLFGFHFDIDAHDDQRSHCYSLDTLVAESLTNLSPSLTNL